jgi:trigger factor
LDTKISDGGPFEKLMTLVVPSGDLRVAEDRAARKLSREVKIKGFRPGHAPRRIVESVVGSKRLRDDAIDDLLPGMVSEALADSDLVPAVNPSVDAIEELDDGVEVTVRITLWPELDTIPEYRDREIEVTAPEVDEEELRTQIDRMRDQFAELETVERPAGEGDYVVINVSAASDGIPVDDATTEDLLIEVGSGQFITGIDEHVTSAKAGDIVSFDGPLPQGFGERAGEPVTFKVLVKEVKEKRLPELTDEWVADVSEFDTADQLRDDLRRRVVDVKRSGAAAQLRNGILEKLIDEMEIEIPEGIIGAEMDAILHRFAHDLERQGISLADYLRVTGQDQDVFVDDLKRQADRNVRTDILLNAVVAAEELEVTDEELAEVIEALAQQAGQEPDAFRSSLGERENVVRGDILRRKALETLTEAAVPIDENGSRIDLRVEPVEETE